MADVRTLPGLPITLGLLCIILAGGASLLDHNNQPETNRKTNSATTEASTLPSSTPVYGKVTLIPARPGTNQSNLWERLTDRFDLEDKSEIAVQLKLAELRIYRRSTLRMLKRAAPYLWDITSAVEARGLPGELALLPAIESRFNPLAHSHKRAVGLWQFMPGTAQHLGLEQNWWFDARLDVTESTQAALDYLEYLYRRFDNWSLALAAYNCGEARLQRAINQADGNTDFWELDLPQETRDYLPRLLALSLLIEDHEDLDIRLPDLPDQQMTDTLLFDRQVDLALVAHAAELDIATLQFLNPSLLRWATPPNGPHRLRLPAGKSKQLQSAMAEIPGDHWTQWQSYMVRDGDRLDDIAQRFGILVADLQLVNQLHSAVIRTGQTLLLPTSAFFASNASQRLITADALPVDTIRVDYQIKPGDTLWDIARMFRVSVEELHRWNGLTTGSILRPGKSLIVWIAADSEPSA